MVHGVLDLTGILFEAIESLGLDKGRVYQRVGSRLEYRDCLIGRDVPQLCTAIWGERYDAQSATLYPGPVGVVLGAQPLWQDVGSLDEQELAVILGDPHPQIWKLLGDLTEDVDNEPFVLYRVSIVGDTMEVDKACQDLSVRRSLSDQSIVWDAPFSVVISTLKASRCQT